MPYSKEHSTTKLENKDLLIAGLQRLAAYEPNPVEEYYFFFKQFSHWGCETTQALLNPIYLNQLIEKLNADTGADSHDSPELQRVLNAIDDLRHQRRDLQTQMDVWMIGLISLAVFNLVFLNCSLSFSVLISMYLVSIAYFPLTSILAPMLCFAYADTMFQFLLASTAVITALSSMAFIGFNIEMNQIDKKLALFEVEDTKIHAYACT